MRLTAAVALLLACGWQAALGQTAGNCTVVTIAGNPTTDAGDGGPAAAAQLYQPGPVAVDAQGNVYIADTGNYRVRKVASDGTIRTVAGTRVRGDDGDGGPATQARLMYPFGLAVDADGVLYIADWQAHRVRKVTPDGKISSVAGNGRRGFSGDGGPGMSAQLNGPRHVAVDAAGRLYIADQWNCRVRQVDTAGTIRTIAGKGCLKAEPTSAQRGDGGPSTEAAFQSVEGVAVDAAGNVFISDPRDLRIRRIGTDGVIQTVVGPVNGYMDAAEGVPALSVRLSIQAFTLDLAGAILLSDYLEPGWLWRVGPDQLLHAVPGHPLPGGELAVSSTGVIYAASGDEVAAIVNGTTSRFAGIDTAGHWGDGGPATSAGLYLPGGLAWDSAGGLLIADSWNQRIRRVDSAGLITTIAGGGHPDTGNNTGDGGPATAAALWEPRWLAVDTSGALYIGDSGGHRICLVGTDGIIHTLAGTGAEGSFGYPFFSYPPLPATSVSIDVNGLAVDSLGTVFLADASQKGFRVNRLELGSIFKITRDGTLAWFSEFQSHFANNNGEGQLFINRNDELFALRPQRSSVEKVTPDGQSTTPVPLSGSFVRDQPTCFTYDKAGNLFVAGFNGGIREITPDGAVTTVFGGSSPNWINGDGPAFQGAPFYAAVAAIRSMITDEAGNFYFSSTDRSRVRMIPTSTCQGAVYPLVAYEGIVNAASYETWVAPGEIVTIFGVNLGPATPESARLGPDGRLATNLGGTRVLFDGVAAPMVYASATQVSAIVPYEMAGKTYTNVVVEYNGFPGESSSSGLYDANPGIFTLDASGKGQAAALNADNSVNGPDNPVARGSVIVLYATGEGQTDPPGVDGAIAGAVLPKPVLPVRVQIGEQETVLEYAGAAPGFAAGLMQVNARVPESVTPGPAVPVVVQVGDRSSQSGVTIGVQ